MEKFDILNEFGEFTNKVESRETVHKEGLWHRAVVLFIITKKKCYQKNVAKSLEYNCWWSCSI